MKSKLLLNSFPHMDTQQHLYTFFLLLNTSIFFKQHHNNHHKNTKDHQQKTAQSFKMLLPQPLKQEP